MFGGVCNRVMELDAEHIEGADDISHDVEVNMLKLQAYVQLSIHNLQVGYCNHYRCHNLADMLACCCQFVQ